MWCLTGIMSTVLTKVASAWRPLAASRGYAAWDPFLRDSRNIEVVAGPRLSGARATASVTLPA